jgi:dipeptidyl aminopeptidase/acylaminoacyl peptidase
MKIVFVSSVLFVSGVFVMGAGLQAQMGPSVLNPHDIAEPNVAEVSRQAHNSGGGGSEETTQERPLLPNDLLAIRSYGATSVSPDGQIVAIEINQSVPGVPGKTYESNQRTELWLASRNGQKQQRITAQRAPLSQWNPVWSPNSQQLAFLSNEGKRYVYLELWDRASGRVRRLATSEVDLGASISRALSKANQNQMLWLDDTHLLAVMLPEGYREPRIDYIYRNALIPSAGVEMAAQGVKPTAIVATSPPRPSNIRDFPQAHVMIFDTQTGTSRVAGDIPVWPSIQGGRSLVVSSNGEWAAFVVSTPIGAIDAESKMSPRDLQWSRLGVVSLGNHGTDVRWVEGVQPSLGDGMIRWKTGDGSFAIVGQNHGHGMPHYLAVVEIPSAKWQSVATLDEERLGSDERMEILNIAWLDDGRIAVRIPPPRLAKTEEDRRSKWWTVAGESAVRLSSADEASLKDGRLPEPDSAIKLQTSETGRIYETDSAGHETTIFPELNPQLKEIEAAHSQNFEYKSLTGETLHAHLILPHGYVPGRRYPTIVWVYAGDIHKGDDTPPRPGDSSLSFLNGMVLTGQGYAVLKPSMPISPAGIPGDPMLHLNDGVDPAVDRAIAMGIVDPDRLALMGHSYGGYSVFGLLTETHRYGAAVALMGVSDLATMYGESASLARYSDPEVAASFGPFMAEWEQLRMGVPPWVDPERYIRNSPLFAADKITTPVLIFAGDLDNLPIQSEAMFTALRRQGKRAEFVRYLGEGHWLESPANLIDMWQRIFEWLDGYLKGESGESQH